MDRPRSVGSFAWLSFVAIANGHWDIKGNREAEEFKSDWMEKEIPVPYPDRPNILLIMADDLGMADLKLYDPNGQSTPHIDRLASEGVRFKHAFVTSPVCSPSRAAIITGRYTQRFGFEYQLHDRYLKNRLEYYAFKLMCKEWSMGSEMDDRCA